MKPFSLSILSMDWSHSVDLCFSPSESLCVALHKPFLSQISLETQTTHTEAQRKEARSVTVVVIGILFVNIEHINLIIKWNSRCGSAIKNFNFVSCAFLTLNSSVNFVIYCLFHPSCRKDLKGCLFRHWADKWNNTTQQFTRKDVKTKGKSMIRKVW